MSVLKKGKVLFSNVVNVDDYSKKYQLVVELTEDDAADAEAAGLKVKTKEYDSKAQFQVVFKTKFRPPVVDAAKNPVDLEGAEIGRGSSVNVQYKFRDWKSPAGETGISADLVGIQVLELTAGNASEFDTEVVGDDDGDSEF